MREHMPKNWRERTVLLKRVQRKGKGELWIISPAICCELALGFPNPLSEPVGPTQVAVCTISSCTCKFLICLGVSTAQVCTASALLRAIPKFIYRENCSVLTVLEKRRWCSMHSCSAISCTATDRSINSFPIHPALERVSYNTLLEANIISIARPLLCAHPDLRHQLKLHLLLMNGNWTSC